MSRPDRKAWARANAVGLAAFFAAVLLYGLVMGNIFALAAGVGGLGWLAWARRG